jgi:hypothetical protein
MGNVIAMTPGIAANLRRQQARTLRHYNLLHHGLPAFLLVLAVGTGAIAGAVTLGKTPLPGESGCGIGVAEENDGTDRLLRRALGNAGVIQIDNLDRGANMVDDVLPSPHPGDRIAVHIVGGGVVSVERVMDPTVKTCAELSPES